MSKKLSFPPVLSRALDALGQENRRKIITLVMSNKDISFSDLSSELNMNSSTLNFHLKELMKASLIDNHYAKTENPGRKYSYYKMTSFGEDLCKSLGIK